MTLGVSRGLDLSKPEEFSAVERQAFTDEYVRLKGRALPCFEFWIENRPDVLKRYRIQARNMSEEKHLELELTSALAMLHYYAIVGFGEGVLYEVHLAEALGASKAELIATLAAAFLHAGPRGGNFVATSSQDYLATYQDPEPGGRFPRDWSVDVDAFRSGLDFSEIELLDGEWELLASWYERVCGEVPEHIRFLAEYLPTKLKAYRHRFEFAIKGDLPKQAMPYFQLHWSVLRGSREGIREAVLMSRGFGLKRIEVMNAVADAMVYAGSSGAGLVESAAGDIIKSWPE